MNEPNVLPADLAPVQHLMEPTPTWPWILAAVLAALLLAALWKRRAPAPSPRPASRPKTPLPTPNSQAGVIAEIDALRARVTEDYRRGCHELAELLREHTERTSAHRAETRTAREIARALGETALSRVFLLLADLQFGRHEPNASDFEGICELAKETVQGTGKIS